MDRFWLGGRLLYVASAFASQSRDCGSESLFRPNSGPLVHANIWKDSIWLHSIVLYNMCICRFAFCWNTTVFPEAITQLKRLYKKRDNSDQDLKFSKRTQAYTYFKQLWISKLKDVLPTAQTNMSTQPDAVCSARPCFCVRVTARDRIYCHLWLFPSSKYIFSKRIVNNIFQRCG